MYKALDQGALGIQLGARDMIALAARCGYDGVSVSPDAIEKEGADAVCGWLEECGLMNAGYGLGGDIHAQGDAYGQELLKAAKRAKLARAAGATRALTWILPGSNDRDFDAQYDYTARRLKPFSDILKNEGITLALEFVGTRGAYTSAKYPFIHNLPEMLRLCDTVGCAVLIDAHHMFTSGCAMDMILDLRADQVGYVHACDAMAGYTADTLPDSPRTLPGETKVVDNAAMLRNLKRIGYEGPVVVEPFYTPFKEVADPGEKARRTIEALNGVWPGAQG